MGFGNYSYDAHQQLIAQRSNMGTNEVFAQTDVHPKMNPKGVKLRESRDSPDHPSSIAVCFALDISGSMGDIPVLLAKQELPTFMKLLLGCKVPDPQVLFMAFADARYDVTPLQVGQFESTAELMDKWLTLTSLFNNVRGTSYTGEMQGGESYELALYFAAKHTATDCADKRGHKGYLFMTGDETAYPAVARETVKTVLGYDIERDVPLEEVMTDLRKSWRPFFLIPDQGRRGVEGEWKRFFGKDVVCMEHARDTCVVAASLVALSEGIVKDEAGLRAALAGVDPVRRDSSITALRRWMNG